MMDLNITRVHTNNQSGEATLFDPYSDALTLVMDISATADLMAVQAPRWSASFQIIEPKTNAVVVHENWFDEFHWGPHFWISLGRSWGGVANYTTPKAWGLIWAPVPSEAVFGFRGIIKAHSWKGEQGLESLDAFDVSATHWFRVKEIFTL